MRRALIRSVGLILLAAFQFGCTESPGVGGGAGEKTVVNGTLLMKGKPATGGTLSFKPAHAPEAATTNAAVQADGKFSVDSISGPCQVTYEGPGFKKEKDPNQGVRTMILDAGATDVVIEF